MAMARLLVLLLLLVSSSVWAEASSQWSFFSAVLYEGAWKQSTGYARVTGTRDKLRIEIYKHVTALPDSPTEPDETIEAVQSSSGVVRGVRTRSGTDAKPVQVVGRYYLRVDKERWGEQPVTVNTESFIFSNSYYSFGLARKVRGH